MNDILVNEGNNFNQMLEEIATVGASSLKILQEQFRLSLLSEAQTYPYEPAEEVVGSGEQEVRQQLGVFEDFPDDSNFLSLRIAFREFLEQRINPLFEYPFEERLNFNSIILQKYPPGSQGISPHRDRSIFINLICIFILGGEGHFFVSKDRSGQDAVEIDSTPGNVILMRAPGFYQMQSRPYHFVKDIPGDRFTLGLRQKRRGTLDEIPKSEPDLI
jgi:hypothetical protein